MKTIGKVTTKTTEKTLPVISKSKDTVTVYIPYRKESWTFELSDECYIHLDPKYKRNDDVLLSELGIDEEKRSALRRADKKVKVKIEWEDGRVC